jgi:hypothetical protein
LQSGGLLREGLVAFRLAGLLGAVCALDACFDEPPENLDDDAALFGFDGWQGTAANRRGNFLERKSRHVYPLFVELKHSDEAERHIDNPGCGANVPSDLTQLK